MPVLTDKSMENPSEKMQESARWRFSNDFRDALHPEPMKHDTAHLSLDFHFLVMTESRFDKVHILQWKAMDLSCPTDKIANKRVLIPNPTLHWVVCRALNSHPISRLTTDF